jgi:hypothetical protein
MRQNRFAYSLIFRLSCPKSQQELATLEQTDQQQGRSGRRVVNYREYLLQKRSMPELEVVAVRAPENRVRHRSAGRSGGEEEERAKTIKSSPAPTVKAEPKSEPKEVVMDLLR